MKDYPKFNFRTPNSEPLGDSDDVLVEESPLVEGQALTGAELFRRQSAGLPVGCAVRSFNQVNPYLEKFSVYDSLNEFRIRHGMVDSSEINQLSEEQESSQNEDAENDAPKE